MDQSLYFKFGLRWLVSSLGLLVASKLLGEANLSVGSRWTTVLFAGLFLALVNMALRPLVLFLSLPAIILSLGLFMLVINGLLIVIASWLYSPLYVRNLGMAIIAGLIVGLVNMLISKAVKEI